MNNVDLLNVHVGHEIMKMAEAYDNYIKSIFENYLCRPLERDDLLYCMIKQERESFDRCDSLYYKGNYIITLRHVHPELNLNQGEHSCNLTCHIRPEWHPEHKS